MASVALLLLIDASLAAPWKRAPAPPAPPTPTQVAERYWQLVMSRQDAEAEKYLSVESGGIGLREDMRERSPEFGRASKLRILTVEYEVIEGDKATVTAEAVSDYFNRRLMVKHDLYRSDGEWGISLIDWRWADGPTP